MSINDGSNILDNALSLAIEDLENRGVSRGDAQIALLIRLRNVVPKDIAEVAEVLNKDPELLSVINKEASQILTTDNVVQLATSLNTDSQLSTAIRMFQKKQ